MLSPRFDSALAYASDAHRRQRRKGTDTPYVAHLLAVCAVVLEHGGDEDQAIAALLHDVVEDQGGPPRLVDVERRFGKRVASIVGACSDAMVEDPATKPQWKERKQRYIAALAHHAPEVWLVSAADKLHNAHTILSDYREVREALWSRFKGGREGTLWYYRALADEFNRLMPGRLAEALEETVARLEAAARSKAPA